MKKVSRVESQESSKAVSSYRDLIAWQKSMDLLVAIYAMTESVPKSEQFGLTSPIKRATVLHQCNEISRILQGLYNSLKSHLATRLSTLITKENLYGMES